MIPEKLEMSVEEFDVFSLRPENANRQLEFIAGEIVENMVSNSESSEIALTIGAYLKFYLIENNLKGRLTTTDGGYQVGKERYMPDVGYLSAKRLVPHAAWVSKAPDLAVEVLSPTDSLREVRIKITNYLNAGTVIWLIDPKAKTLEVHAPAQAVIIYGINDTLKGDPALPGFIVEMQKIFA